jgi:hypothetical protein
MTSSSEKESQNNNVEDKDIGKTEEAASTISMQRQDIHGLEKVTSDFQCFVCGAIFNTDEDRKQHLLKEAQGRVRDESTQQEKDIAKEQEEWNESHAHRV